MEKLKQTYIYNIGSQFISIVSKDELDTFNGFLFESLGGSSINAEFVVPNNQKVKLMNKSGIITKMKARLCVRDAYNNFGELSHLKTMESVEFVGIDVFDSKIVPNVTKIHKGMLNLNLMSAGRFKVLILRDNIEQGVFNDKIELNMVVLGRNIRKVGDDLIQLIKRTKSKVYIVRNSTTNDILREHLRDVLVEYVDSTDDAIQQIEDKKKTAIKQYNRIKALATVNNIYSRIIETDKLNIRMCIAINKIQEDKGTNDINDANKKILSLINIIKNDSSTSKIELSKEAYQALKHVCTISNPDGSIKIYQFTPEHGGKQVYNIRTEKGVETGAAYKSEIMLQYANKLGIVLTGSKEMKSISILDYLDIGDYFELGDNNDNTYLYTNNTKLSNEYSLSAMEIFLQHMVFIDRIPVGDKAYDILYDYVNDSYVTVLLHMREVSTIITLAYKAKTRADIENYIKGARQI